MIIFFRFTTFFLFVLLCYFLNMATTLLDKKWNWESYKSFFFFRIIIVRIIDRIYAGHLWNKAVKLRLNKIFSSSLNNSFEGGFSSFLLYWFLGGDSTNNSDGWKVASCVCDVVITWWSLGGLPGWSEERFGAEPVSLEYHKTRRDFYVGSGAGESLITPGTKEVVFFSGFVC